jgi:hypothetical protein
MGNGGNDPYRDLMLASFANLANQAALDELGISVVVGGCWLTGQLVGARLWFEGLARSLEESGTPGGFADVIRLVGAQVYPSESEREAVGTVGALGGADADPTLPSFLHLRDACLITSDGRRVPTGGGFVRVRVDEVAAWMLGRIGPLARPGPAREA